MFSPKTSHHGSLTRTNRRLDLEGLESRQMMATTRLVLDFTPDTRYGSFADTFRYSQYTDGTYPNWLDFNGDRVISNTDVNIAASQITSAVGSYFVNAARGYSVGVYHNDVMQNNNFGLRYLQYGQNYSSEQVLVMYFGGRNEGELGRAPLARDGYNVEGYGQTYTQETAHMLMRRSGATKEIFVWTVAGTAAHEFGHMLGLRHSRNVYSDDLMNPAQSQQPWNDVFSNVNQYTEDGPVQNAVSELRRSFYGQQTYFQGVDGGHRQLAADEHIDCNHGYELHGDEHDQDIQQGDGLLSIDSLAALLAEVRTAKPADMFTDFEDSAKAVAPDNGQLAVGLAPPIDDSLRASHKPAGLARLKTAETSSDDLFAAWDSLGEGSLVD